MKKYRLLNIIFVLIISFVINIDGVYAFSKLKCLYKLPYSGAVADNTALVQGDGTLKSDFWLVTYETKNGGKDYTLKYSSPDGKSDKFKSDKFNKTVIKQGGCPEYVEIYHPLVGIELKTSSKSKIMYDLNESICRAMSKGMECKLKDDGKNILSFVVYSDSINYDQKTLPLYKVNDKVETKYITPYYEEQLTRWNKIMKKINSSVNSKCGDTSFIDYDNYKSDYKTSDFQKYVLNEWGKTSLSKYDQEKNISKSCWNARKSAAQALQAANKFYSVTSSDDTLDKIARKVGGDAYSALMNFTIGFNQGSSALANIKVTEDQVNENENAKDEYDSNPCTNFCTQTYSGCLSSSGTAKEECAKKCVANNFQAKCEAAYDACKSKKKASKKKECLEKEFSNKGIGSYSAHKDALDDIINELDKKIKNGKSNLKVAKVPKLNVSFDKEGYKLQCDDVKAFKTIWNYTIIIAPILVILFGTLDFVISTISADEEKIRKARTKFPKRLIAAIIIFAVPNLVSLIVWLSSDSSAQDTSLLRCIVSWE